VERGPGVALAREDGKTGRREDGKTRKDRVFTAENTEGTEYTGRGSSVFSVPSLISVVQALWFKLF